MKFRFHALGVPHTITSEEYVACAYTQKVLKFCKMMTQRGHEVYHYGHEDSEVICTEHVPVLSRDTYNRVYGEHDFKSKWFKYDLDDDAYKEFYRRAIEEVGKRKQKNDFILPFWGWGTKPICDAHPDIMMVEPGIGYSNVFADYRVYESYAMMHSVQGEAHTARCNPRWYDTVIPNYFDLKDFTFHEEKEDYMAFVGRVYDGKGVNIAVQVTDFMGLKLKVAGQLGEQYEDFEWPDHVEFVGHVNVHQRNELMGKAMGIYVPSTYNEPFGGVQIEALLCGTPTITTDFGAFTENNIEGVTGYRCRTFKDFVMATKKVVNKEIDYKKCREHGEKFSLENIAPKYEKYFEDLYNSKTHKGWYAL